MARESAELVSKIPFRIQGTDEFFDLVSAFGCQVDGEHVRFPRSVIDQVLDRMEKERNISTKSHKAIDNSITDPGVEMYTHGQAFHICDIKTNKIRPATKNDLESWCRLVDSMGITKRSHPTFIPSDVPRRSASLHAYVTIALNSTIPHRVSVYTKEMLPFFVEAGRIASIEAESPNPVYATKCWVNSPFMITRENIEIAMEARRLLGREIEFGVMPVAGASTPITVSGALVQNTAEAIALSALRLAIDDLLHPLATTSTILDMGDASHRQSGPDLFIHSVAATDMQRYLTGVSNPPFYFTGVSAPTVSPQSLYEKGLAAGHATALGMRSLGVGCLSYSDVGSPVQLTLDVAMGRQLGELFRPISWDAEHRGIDTIESVAPTGARYLEADQTLRFFREESWLQDLVDHRPPLAWANSPSDMIDRARENTIDLETKAENRSPLDQTARSTLTKILDEADALVNAE